MSISKFQYGDIPDRFVMKEFYPLGRHTWDTFVELGVDYWEVGIDSLAKPGALYEFFNSRLNNSILTSKQVMDGTITEEQSQKVFTYSLFPPIFCIRSDLQQGMQKLLMGESVDATFILLDDQNQETFFMLNSHQEDGVPVDWFSIAPGDDLMERRHLKYGYKIKEFPKRMKNNLGKVAKGLIDILMDVRNERTPQWANSDYFVAIAWMGAAVNSINIISNHEAIVCLWDYFNAKRKYGLPMEWIGYFPTPTMLNTFLFLNRPDFMLRFAGLASGNNLYCMGLEEYIYDWFMKELPEMFKIIYERGWGHDNPPDSRNYGILLPDAEGHCYPPNLKKKDAYDKEIFDFEFRPPHYANYPKITIDTFKIDFETARHGVYTDISNHTTDKDEINESNVVSLGLAKDTKIIR